MSKTALAAALAVLPAAPDAAASHLVRVAVVGADGRSAELRIEGAIRRDFYPLRYRVAHPRGPYLLVYPLLDVARLPAARHAYYPRTRVLCPGVAPPSGLCPRVSDALRKRLADLRLKPHDRPPTRIVGVMIRGRPFNANSALARAFELAFARSDRARRAWYPRRCAHVFVASWRGPQPRPRRFCLARRGLYAGARVYPIPHGLYEVAASF